MIMYVNNLLKIYIGSRILLMDYHNSFNQSHVDKQVKELIRIESAKFQRFHQIAILNM